MKLSVTNVRKRTCPHCDCALKPLNARGIEVDVCPSCNGSWFGMQLLSLKFGNPGVDYWAHIGGFVFGFLGGKIVQATQESTYGLLAVAIHGCDVLNWPEKGVSIALIDLFV